MSRIRVLQVVLNLEAGGLEQMVCDLVSRLDASTFESHVLCAQFLGRRGAGLEDLVPVHVVPSLPRWSMLFPRSLLREIGAIRPHVVHTHTGVWYKGSLAAALAHTPLIVHTEHGRPHEYTTIEVLSERLALRWTDVVVPVSEALRAEFAQKALRRARLQLVYNGVDTDRFRPGYDDDSLRHELGLTRDVPIILSVGRLDPVKAYDLMLRAFAVLLRHSRASVVPALVITGDGPERARLAGETAKLGIEKNVHFIGWRTELPGIYNAAALFTLSSHSEGTSIGLLEAMSSGLCPIVSDVGGNRAVLGAGLSHRLVPAGNHEALAAAWEDALARDEARRFDAKAARDRVVQRFGIDAMVRAYEGIYSQALSREHNPGRALDR